MLKSPTRRQSALYLALTLSLSLSSSAGCGGQREVRGLEWSGGERLRWARFNPCACLNSERLITSLELRPIAQGEAPDGRDIGLERWERVALRRPLSPELLTMLKALKARGGAATQLLVNLSAQQTELIEGHVLRVVSSLSLPDVADEAAELAPPKSSPKGDAEGDADSAQRSPVDLP
jgi:hypothetical protein